MGDKRKKRTDRRRVCRVKSRKAHLKAVCEAALAARYRDADNADINYNAGEGAIENANNSHTGGHINAAHITVGWWRI